MDTVTPAGVLVGNKKIIDLPEQASPPASWLLFTGEPADGKLYKTQRQNLGFIESTRMGQPGGVATLDANAKLMSSQIPAIAITDTYVVDSEAEMLALDAETGDVAIRNDTGLAYILQNNPASELVNWVLLATPGVITVTSINGKTGNVILDAGDGLSYDNATGLFRLGKLATDTTSTQGTIYNDTVLALDGAKKFSIAANNESAQIYIRGGLFVPGDPIITGMQAKGYVGGNPQYNANLEAGVSYSLGAYLTTTMQSGATPFYVQNLHTGGCVTTYNIPITWNDSSGLKQIKLQRQGVDWLVYDQGMLSFGTPYQFNAAFINGRMSAGISAFIHFARADNSTVMRLDGTMCIISGLSMVLASSTIQSTGINNYFQNRTMFGHTAASTQPLTLVQMGTEANTTNSIVTISNIADTVARVVTANLYIDRRITPLNLERVISPSGIISNCIVATGVAATANILMSAAYNGSILGGRFEGGFINDVAPTTTIACGNSVSVSTTIIASIASVKSTQATTLNGWMTGFRSVFFSNVSGSAVLSNFADLAVGFSEGTPVNITNRYALYIADMGSSGRWGIYQQGTGLQNLFNGTVNIANSTKIYTAGLLPSSTSAILELASTTKGFLPPQMTQVQRNAISAPSTGLVVYQTDATPGLRVFNGTNWMRYTETAD